MRSKVVRAFTFGAISIAAATMAHAQLSSLEGQSIDVGKYEYDTHCVACHGSTGKGDGFYALMLSKNITVTNLTELSKKNNGVFPFSRVYETIDGRKQVQAHGTREMPVWGRSYSAMVSNLYPYYDPEGFARAKILALTEYIYRLQAK